MMKMFELSGATDFPGWKINENDYITLTPQLAAGAAGAMMQHYAACFGTEAAKYAQIEACADVEALAACGQTLGLGWPSSMGSTGG